MTILDALASPARQELVSQLGEGPATVRELALALGRSRQALHYHIGLLERAGLVKGAGWRGRGPAREQLYEVTMSRMVAEGASTAHDREAARKAVAATLRLASREVARALAAPDVRRRGRAPEFAALRGRTRLTDAQLLELSGLFGQIEALIRRGKRGRGKRHYAVTLMLVPTGPFDRTSPS